MTTMGKKGSRGFRFASLPCRRSVTMLTMHQFEVHVAKPHFAEYRRACSLMKHWVLDQKTPSYDQYIERPKSLEALPILCSRMS